MIRHQPPLLGATGIDFGLKPAISFVLPKKKTKLLEDEDAPPCPAGEPWVCTVKVQATLSGHLQSGSECIVPDTDFDISAVTDEATCNSGGTIDTCISGCITVPAPITFTCPSECLLPTDPPAPTFQVEAGLFWSGTPGDDWFIVLNVFFDINVICGASPNVGNEGIYELNIGPDPSGPHTLSFNDPDTGSVHYEVLVTVTPFATSPPYCPGLGF